MQAARKSGVGTYRQAELDALPAPVTRYLRLVLMEGQPMIRRARVTWRGEFNMGHAGSDKWKPFAATQEYVVGTPGFVWDVRIAMAPGVPVLVRDGLSPEWARCAVPSAGC